MTSSLVGSEMCIRDRLWACALGGAGVVGAAVPGVGLGGVLAGVAVSVGPVSYTHLTLPTICSV
eukprot:11036597-Prorocentrum_lima.AAC.1